MARKQVKTSETTADTSIYRDTEIYLSILAKDHNDLLDKIDQLYNGLCRPAAAQTKRNREKAARRSA